MLDTSSETDTLKHWVLCECVIWVSSQTDKANMLHTMSETSMQGALNCISALVTESPQWDRASTVEAEQALSAPRGTPLHKTMRCLTVMLIPTTRMDTLTLGRRSTPQRLASPCEWRHQLPGTQKTYIYHLHDSRVLMNLMSVVFVGRFLGHRYSNIMLLVTVCNALSNLQVEARQHFANLPPNGV